MKLISVLGAAVIIFAAFGLTRYLSDQFPDKFSGKPLAAMALFWLAAACFVLAAVKFKLKTVYACIGVFTLSLLFQRVYGAFVTIEGESDLRFYFSNAVSIFQNGFRHESLYSATFPGTVTYPAVLAVLFKFIGVGRGIPVLLNQLVMSATIVMAYLYMRRRHGPASGAVCAMLLATHPFVIIYCNVCNAEILYGACILWCFFSFCFARERYASHAQKRWFICPAFFLGLSLLFRPLGVVMLIALAIYALFYMAAGTKDKLMICSVLLAGYMAFNLLCGAVVKGITSYDAPRSSYGWNLYVGGSEEGRWNQADGAEFARVMALSETPTEVQAYFAPKAFARYKDMGAGILRHCLNKLERWHAAEYISRLDEESARANTLTKDDYMLPVSVYYVPILLLALAFFLWSCVRSFLGKIDEMSILTLYTIGSFAALMLLELSPRYTVSYHIMFSLPAFELVAGLTALRHGKRKKTG
ncbi:MAG: glycosyltransferase family 39 protein [Oscillospiraceae bacterium]|nr:glycosyltransferase family 39 protein [Oscillospiraceae bacterium]